MKTHLKIAERIKVRREIAGMTQKQLASITGLSTRGVGEIECGNKPQMALRSVMLIATALGLDVGWLVGDRWQ